MNVNRSNEFLFKWLRPLHEFPLIKQTGLWQNTNLINKEIICPFQCQVPCRGSLPAHCHKILQRKRNGHTYIDRMVQNKWKAYLGRNETRGYIFRHESRNMFAKHSSINTKKTSHHPFTLNDFNVPGYVVCYGIHNPDSLSGNRNSDSCNIGRTKWKHYG